MLVEREVSRKNERRIEMAFKIAHFPMVRELADFDFKAQPGVDPRQVRELAASRWIAHGDAVLQQGVAVPLHEVGVGLPQGAEEAAGERERVAAEETGNGVGDLGAVGLRALVGGLGEHHQAHRLPADHTPAIDQPGALVARLALDHRVAADPDRHRRAVCLYPLVRPPRPRSRSLRAFGGACHGAAATMIREGLATATIRPPRSPAGDALLSWTAAPARERVGGTGM